MGVVGVLLLLPTWAGHCRPHRSQPDGGGGPSGRPGPTAEQAAGRERAVTLEAWVLLSSYRGCPVLVERAGYRLGLVCDQTGGAAGFLAFAGPFAGRAFMTDEVVPLGKWVHVAGSHDGWVTELLIDRRWATATALGRLPLPLGRDPWEWSPTAGGKRCLPDCPARRRPLDGELGGSRLVWRGRTAAQLTATRGSPGHFAAIDEPGEIAAFAQQRAPSAPPPAQRMTPTGWLIAGAVLAASSFMVAFGVFLLARSAAEMSAVS
ncbi:MAG TPA: LamG-like jellyroll fold domain-containing protein [Thermoanaerobaculia bacterium]|nr:LamG-like jellyroll fold domain-containing protein [Thermoanaerobaculia bacterium]